MNTFSLIVTIIFLSALFYMISTIISIHVKEMKPVAENCAYIETKKLSNPFAQDMDYVYVVSCKNGWVQYKFKKEPPRDRDNFHSMELKYFNHIYTRLEE